jgi:hypothetical protein
MPTITKKASVLCFRGNFINVEYPDRLGNYRRLSKDYEFLFIVPMRLYAAMTHLMIRGLARQQAN